MTWAYVEMALVMLAIILIFITLIVRVGYFAVILHIDPIKAITPPSPREIYNSLPTIKRERKEKREKLLNALS